MTLGILLAFSSCSPCEGTILHSASQVNTMEAALRFPLPLVPTWSLLLFLFLLSLFSFPSPLLQFRVSPCLSWVSKIVFYLAFLPPNFYLQFTACLDSIKQVALESTSIPTPCRMIYFQQTIIVFRFPMLYFNTDQNVLNDGAFVFLYCLLLLLASFPFCLCRTTSDF